MIERLLLRRLQLHCPVSLWRPADGTFISAVTEDLMSTGFFTPTDAPYAVGHQLEAILEIPAPL